MLHMLCGLGRDTPPLGAAVPDWNADTNYILNKGRGDHGRWKQEINRHLSCPGPPVRRAETESARGEDGLKVAQKLPVWVCSLCRLLPVRKAAGPVSAPGSTVCNPQFHFTSQRLHPCEPSPSSDGSAGSQALIHHLLRAQGNLVRRQAEGRQPGP